MADSVERYVRVGRCIMRSGGISGLALRLSLLWALISGMIQGPAVSAGPSADPIPPAFFGMHVGMHTGGWQEWPTIPVGAMGKGTGISWAFVEPARGVFKWYGIDHYLAAAESHRVDFFYAFGNTPQWASARPAEHCANGNVGCAAPPAKIEYWNEFVTALVTRYKGRIKFYEIWDEPNTRPQWSGTYVDMVLLASNAYTIIKSIDPNAVVLTPATANGGVGYQVPGSPTSGVPAVWMQRYLQAGGNRYADGGNYHGYLGRTTTTAYRLPEDSASPCMMVSWNYTKSCSGSVLNQVDTMRAVFDENGMAGKPMFNTEGSWGNSSLTDPDLQAAWLARYYLLQASRGVARVYWYGWDVGAWGLLWSKEGGLNVAGIAYGQIYEWLVGATVSSACSAAGNRTTWTCSFTRPGGYQALAVWDTSGNQIYVPDPTRYRQYRDLMGHTSPVNGAVTVGIKPILLETTTGPLH